MSAAFPFRPTRAAGLERLAAFAPRAGVDYATRRNHDPGPDRPGHVSALSPYLRHRLLTEHEVIAAVLAHHPQGAQSFVTEVFWRTYFKGYLQADPAIWRRYRAGLAQHLATLDEAGGRRGDYDSAVAGRTGIDGFDAWVAELRQTGYLHNHVRMWFASIWIFTLRLPWELGADFMYRHLLDGDPASNTLSWRWVAGLHTRGKIYLARREIIASCTDARFSPDGLAEDAAPLEETEIADDGVVTELPSPPVAGRLPPGRIGLLLTEEDLNPESLDLGDARIAAIAGASDGDARSPLGVSNLVRAFTTGALDDGLMRGAAFRGVETQRLQHLTAPALTDWARSHDFTAIATAIAPVGPVASALAEAEPHLGERGIRLLRVQRPFDAVTWPQATRGFFRLRKKIPALLRDLELA